MSRRDSAYQRTCRKANALTVAANCRSDCGITTVHHTLTDMATESDYYIVTFDTVPWAWELRRRGTPMGVRIRAGGYESQSAAEHAGQGALTEFLALLEREEQRSRKALR